MSAAAASSATAGWSILLVRPQYSPNYVVNLEFDSDSLMSRRLPELIRDNPPLAQGLRIDGFDPAQIYNRVGEAVVRDLHILLHLHDSCVAAAIAAASTPAAASSAAAAPTPAAAALHVTFVSQDALNPWFRDASSSVAHLSTSAAPIGFSPLRVAQMNPDRAAAFPHATPTTAAELRPAGKKFSNPIRKSPLSYRFCTSLVQALQTKLPTRVLFLPSLLWYKEFGTYLDLRTSTQSLLSSIAQKQGIAAHLYPPLRWDDLLEQKDVVYKRFKSVMLPAIWRPLHGFHDSHVLQLAQRLVCGLPPGRYVLKGSFDYCASSVLTDIQIQESDQSPPAELLHGIRALVDKNNQHCFGLQPFVPSLGLREFRHWCLAAPSEGRRQFRLLLTVRTSFMRDGPNEGKLLARLSVPVDPAAIACHDLVQSILRDNPYSSLRDELINAGCYAIRIDCGFDDRPGVAPRAFINEFTAPADAVTFCHAHETELVWAIALMFADGILQLLRSPR